MDIAHVVTCGLFMVTLFLRLNAKPFTTSQQKVTRNLVTGNHTEFLVIVDQEQKPRGNTTGVVQEPQLDTRVKGKKFHTPADPPKARRKQPGSKNKNKKGYTRNNCFGHKLDRISDRSGMGC